MLDWRGELVAAHVEAAAIDAAEAVVDDAVEEARDLTPVDTGRARDSLRREDSGLTIHWGYHATNERGFPYPLLLEIGQSGRTGHHALRRSADRHYPRLVPEISRRFGRG